jgi:hypothetical protein
MVTISSQKDSSGTTTFIVTAEMVVTVGGSMLDCEVVIQKTVNNVG